MNEPTRRAWHLVVAGAVSGLLVAAVATGLNREFHVAQREAPPEDFGVTGARTDWRTSMPSAPTAQRAAHEPLSRSGISPGVLFPPSSFPNAEADSPERGRDPTFDRPGAQPAPPSRLVIPSLQLDVPIVAATWVALPEINAGYFDAPALRAAGWQSNSARLGDPGNLVLSGHNNILGRVFENLKDLKAGDPVYVRAGPREIAYQVTERRLLLEKDQPLDVRTANARYIEPGGEDRLTLVTCWPPDNNTHRIIVIARPVSALTGGP